MARRINYGFEKRQKEAKRKKKQEEKLEKKRLAKEAGAGATLPDGTPVPTEETPAETAPEDGTEDPNS
jgi:hypothetical protein